MAMWNPWRGCRKCSEGCLHCYIHKGDAKLGINTHDIVKTKDFYKPIKFQFIYLVNLAVRLDYIKILF